jgi:hypothetical protein
MINESIAPFTIDKIYSKKLLFYVHCTGKKENKIFLIYKEIQMGSVAKSYMRKGFLIYEKIRKYLTIYEEAVSKVLRQNVASHNVYVTKRNCY